MKAFLGFIIGGLMGLNTYGQDLQTKAFLNSFFGQSAKIVYTDKLWRGQIESIGEALKLDTLYKNPANKKYTDYLVLTQQEHDYIQTQVKQLAILTWPDKLFTNGTVITQTVVDSIFNDRKRSWQYFEARYGSRLYNFSKPVFIRNHTLCIFYSGYSCGNECGGGSLSLYRNENGNWTEWMVVYSWVS